MNLQRLALIEEESSYVCVRVNPAGKVKYIPVATPFDPLDPANACLAAGGVPFAPKAAVLGTVTLDGAGLATGTPQLWGDPITTAPELGATETWEIWNFTADAHPIHLHLVHFEVIDRELFLPGATPNTGTLTGAVRGPEPWELGPKDTVIVYPGEVARLKATFDIAGLYVWHCHIVEHEDNEMMVPYCVDDPAVDQSVAGTSSYCGPQAAGGM
jgi:FtsP/CotA-like multicopper oxidase with cupredoxin domain